MNFEGTNIPNIIHYCWFGRGPKDSVSRLCMKTWEKYASKAQIIEWNEDNVEIEKMPLYVREAYREKKYAFVSDYVRLLKMYEMGGVYLDTDMEICKEFESNFGKFNTVLCFFENMPMTAFFASVPGNPVIKRILEHYNERKFVTEDGTYDMLPIDYPFFEYFEKEGLKGNGEYQVFGDRVACYPNCFFCGIDTDKWRVKYSKETCMVHHVVGSWIDKKKSIKKEVKTLLQKVLGIHRYCKIFG